MSKNVRLQPLDDTELPAGLSHKWASVLCLARKSCEICEGRGYRPTWGGKPVTCDCVKRAVFRQCYEQFHACRETEYLSRSATEARIGHVITSPSSAWGQSQEFMTDFRNIGRRALDDSRYWLFRFHYLQGLEAAACYRYLAITPGQFKNEKYAIEKILGAAFRETEPYGLHPLSRYFGSSYRDKAA